jgi:hypothetical protein
VGATGGYPKFFCDVSEASGDAIDVTGLRERSVEYLRGLERRHRCTILTAQAIARLHGTKPSGSSGCWFFQQGGK